MKDFVKAIIDWAEVGVCVAVGVAAYKATSKVLGNLANKIAEASKEKEIVEVKTEED